MIIYSILWRGQYSPSLSTVARWGVYPKDIQEDAYNHQPSCSAKDIVLLLYGVSHRLVDGNASRDCFGPIGRHLCHQKSNKPWYGSSITFLHGSREPRLSPCCLRFMKIPKKNSMGSTGLEYSPKLSLNQSLKLKWSQFCRQIFNRPNRRIWDNISVICFQI